MITEIRNGNNVKRFHTTERIRDESVGHHSANVCAILLRLDPGCSRELLVAALMHDVAECYTGDVPAPFKWENPEAKVALAAGEMSYFEEYDIPYPQLSSRECQRLKLADMLDLVLSSLEDLGRGNVYANELVQNGQDYIMAMDIDDDTMLIVGDMIGETKAAWQLTTDR